MILHIDMDAFYAAVEERENPDLAGKPVAVGGQPSSRGVVAAANYVARKYGVYSAMPMITAVEKCPKLLIIKPNSTLYNEVSRELKEIFFRYSPIVEPLSLDEAFLDPGGSEKLYGSAIDIGLRIKEDIRNELKLVASVGVAPNKFLAKLASDFNKPDGFTVITEDEVQDFLDPLDVGKIWGVGKAAQDKLFRNKIRTVRDLRCQSELFLRDLFGIYGEQLWKLSRGIDNRKVTPDSEVKSMSQETTFERDVDDYISIESTTLHLTEGVSFRLRQAKLKGKTVSLKIRFDDFKTITRSKSLPAGTDSTNLIWETASSLLQQTLTGKQFSIRLMGVAVSNFSQDTSVQSSLFDMVSEVDGDSDQGNQIDRLSDEIRNKYGKESIKRGKSIH